MVSIDPSRSDTCQEKGLPADFKNISDDLSKNVLPKTTKVSCLKNNNKKISTEFQVIEPF